MAVYLRLFSPSNSLRFIIDMASDGRHAVWYINHTDKWYTSIRIRDVAMTSTWRRRLIKVRSAI